MEAAEDLLAQMRARSHVGPKRLETSDANASSAGLETAYEKAFRAPCLVLAAA